MPGVLEGKRIFIIEDDVMSLAVFATAMRKNGAVIYQDVFGYGIVQHIIESLPIDLILLDIMLSRGIDGYEIYDELRLQPKLRSIPVVVVTSLDPEIEMPRARAKGVNGYISKPISSYEFSNHIAAVLRGQQVWIVSR